MDTRDRQSAKLEDSERLCSQATAYSKSSSTQKPSKALPLTSLRFFAALYVVFFHTLVFVFAGAKDLSTVHGRILELGYISVGFFFTLSGYILAVSYLPRNVSKGKFWRARFARIYPLFFLTLLMDCPPYLIGAARQVGYHSAFRDLLKGIFENMLFLQAWVPSVAAIDFPNWSLAVEAFFYLLFPFLIARFAWPRVRVLVAAGALSYVTGMAFVTLAMHSHASLDVLKYNPLFHLNAFLCGTLLGAIRLKRRPRPAYAPAFLCAAIACFAVTVHYYRYIPLPLIHDGLLVPAFICLILAFDSGNKTLEALLSFRWLVVLGEASYGLYLIHIPLWDILHHFRIERSPAVYPVYLVGAVTVSVLSFFYIETPLRLMLTTRIVGAPRTSSSGLSGSGLAATWRESIAVASVESFARRGRRRASA